MAFTYRETNDFDFLGAPVYTKRPILKSNVEFADHDQELVTAINGEVETKTKIKKGAAIVTGSAGERYSPDATKPGKFATLYEDDPTDPTRYRSKNKVYVVRLTEDTEITAPWGDKQSTRVGGVVAQRVEDAKDVYLIHEAPFRDEWVLVSGNPV